MTALGSEAPGGHGERLARGALLQQGAQIARLIGGLVVVTLLAHRLSLPALGTYTILLSMITYIMFVKSSVMNAAIVGVARADGSGRPEELEVVVSTGFFIYLLIGIVSGALLCGIGLLILPSLNVPHRLYDAARLGVVGLSLATFLSWPVQIFDDLLRGLQRFSAVSLLEISAMVAYVAGAVAMALSGAPVWALVTWNASIPLLMGLFCLLALRTLGLSIRISPTVVTRAETRRFGRMSGLLILGGIADLAIYSIDRIALSALRSPAAVGRYEGPLGAQNMIRYLNGVIGAPVLPIASAFLAADDHDRVRELFLRGLRYCYAATVPLTVTMIVYAAPILRLWLGDRFGSVGTAASVFSAFWLLGASGGMVSVMLIAAGRTRRLAVGSWIAGAINVVLVFTLTGALGIYGPIIASLVAYTTAMLVSFPTAMRVADVGWRRAAIGAWLPSISTGVILAAALLLLRWDAHLTGKPETLIVVLLAPLGYWALYWAIWLNADERHLALYALRLRSSRH